MFAKVSNLKKKKKNITNIMLSCNTLYFNNKCDNLFK